MSPGNATLIPYGIQTEGSAIRAHVCPVVRRVYVYPTSCGVSAAESGRFIKRPAYQNGIDTPTAEGYLIPPFEISRCVALTINGGVWAELNMSADDTLAQKGRKATTLVKQMLLLGLFPIPALALEVTAKDLQIIGTDILIRAGTITKQDISIQVKCDYPGGERELGGTGNLFVQVAECNPFGIY